MSASRNRRCCPAPSRGSDTVEQSHKTSVHVILHVAVEEAQARLIGGEVESHFLGAAEHRYVLDHPGRRHPDDARDLKAVTVLTGEVVCLTNGKFIAYGPMGGGVERNHGPSMVFRVAGIDSTVIMNNGQATDLGQLR